MGKRLSRIVTRTGDDGTTSLGDGSRVTKDSLRVDALGDIDELNSHVGTIIAFDLPGEVREILIRIQHHLFDIGAELCIPKSTKVTEAYLKDLDEAVERFNTPLPFLREFILPGGCAAAAVTHSARAVCRRAERAVLRLARKEDVSLLLRQYLNRLSDLLFIVARTINQAAGIDDHFWKPHSELGK